MTDASVRARRIRFEFPTDLDPVWSRRFPEFACAANGVSLLMPSVEPYVVRSVRAGLDALAADGALDDRLAADGDGYLAQERAHHGQHHRFNALLLARYPALARVEGWMDRVFGWLGHSRSMRFNLAFAAGFEAVAYATARWTEDHLDRLFDGADARAATLLLWHLAEEVEHKTVAFDVARAAGVRRRTYAAGMVTSLVLLGLFTVMAMWVMLAKEGRWWRPVTHWRLLRWWLSFTFEVLPSMAVSVLPSHHPSRLADPIWLTTWLRQYDEATGTLPVLDGLVGAPAA